MTAPPPPPTSYRPWEDPSPKPAVNFTNGRPSLPPLPVTTISPATNRRATAISQDYTNQNPRKRRRLSNEVEHQQQYTLPSLTPSSPQNSRRSSDGGRWGDLGGRERERESGEYADNQLHLQDGTSRPTTPALNHQSQSTNALSVLVSSIHNLVLDLPATSSPTSTVPAQITPHQIPSIETLTTCLDTVFTLLLRSKSHSQSPLAPPPPPSAVSAGTDPAYSSNLSSLRHSLSTLQLSHTTLTKEHNVLLSAYARSQTRATTLEKKLLVCTDENESLSNERERLQGVVEGLEESLIEVREERDELRDETRKLGLQWGRILNNAGKLATEAGGRQKGLRREVEELKEEVALLRGATAGNAVMLAAGAAGGGETDREKRELKLRIIQLEKTIEDLKKDGKGVLELAEKLARLGRGIADR